VRVLPCLGFLQHWCMNLNSRTLGSAPGLRLGSFLNVFYTYRMAVDGRALWGSPRPTPCLSRGTQSRLHRTASRRVCISPGKGTTQPLCADCARAPSPSEGTSSSLASASSTVADLEERGVCDQCRGELEEPRVRVSTAEQLLSPAWGGV